MENGPDGKKWEKNGKNVENPPRSKMGKKWPTTTEKNGWPKVTILVGIFRPFFPFSIAVFPIFFPFLAFGPFSIV